MRFMTTGIAACAASLLAISPASACSWGKTASAENMTVADSSISAQDSADISIATNDISDATLKEMATPVPPESPSSQ